MAEPSYEAVIARILDILEHDDKLSKKVKEFRFGELPEEHFATALPACYVTTAIRPEVTRAFAGPASSHLVFPTQRIVSEFWIILIDTKSTAETAQKSVYSLRDDVIRILSGNIQLRKDGADPMCAAIEIDSIGRLTKQRGKILDGLTVMVRTVQYSKTE